MSSASRPTLAMVSTGIRRDLLAPLVYFSKFDLLHFYKISVYGDLTAADMDASLRKYTSPLNLYQQLVAAKSDVIQTVEPFSFYTLPNLWATFFAARKTRAALLVPTFENRPFDIKFDKLRAAFLRRTLNIIFARACLILTLNNGARENVLACGAAPEKIVHAMWGSWGVDMQEFFPRPTRPSNLPPTVLFVGRLHQEKGIFVLLDAFTRVRAKMPFARLILAGEGPAHDEVISRIDVLGLKSSVTVLGTIKNRDMPSIFHQADVFCAPSLTTPKWAEQVGMSALQAMASGVPVVSTDSGAIPEYIPDSVAGILVPENDSTALANALLELLANPDRAQTMGNAGREYACTHYDARTNVAQGEQLVMEHCLARRI